MCSCCQIVRDLMSFFAIYNFLPCEYHGIVIVMNLSGILHQEKSMSHILIPSSGSVSISTLLNTSVAFNEIVNPIKCLLIGLISNSSYLRENPVKIHQK